jgi:chorismate mutase
MSLEELKVLREEVARITLEIIRLSSRRLSLVRKIGEIKARNNMAVEDPSVEDDLKARVIDLSKKYNVNVDFSLKLLNLLLEESKRVQREIMKSR